MSNHQNDIIRERVQEEMNDTCDTHKTSSCCYAAVYQPTSKWAQCLSCLEYCDVVEEAAEKNDLEEAKAEALKS